MMRLYFSEASMFALLWFTIIVLCRPALVEGAYFTTKSDPFMPPWPQAAPNGPVHMPAGLAVPNGGGSLGIFGINGRAFSLNNYMMLPIQQQITNAGTILSVQDVNISWAPRALPPKCVPTMTIEQRFLLVGTNTSELLLLQDTFYNVERPAGSPPSFTFKRTIFDATQKAQLSNVLGDSWAPSDFCDFDNDGERNEILLGGATGKIMLVKLRWNDPVLDTPTTLTITSPLDTRISTLNAHASILGEVYSKPTCAQKDAGVTHVGIGYKSGKVLVFSYNALTQLWTLLETVNLDPGLLVYPVPMGSPVNNIWAQPSWVDLDSDNIFDGMAVSARNGAMYLLFGAYSRTGCTTPTCALGSFPLGCTCKPCPAGTYRDLATQQWCKVCGGVDKYCGESSQFPTSRETGYCTYWAPYPSASNPTVISPYFPKDVTYYSDNFGSNGGANIILEDGNTININTYWTIASMQQEMFGGMKSWRNRASLCGAIELTEEAYRNVPGANSMNGTIAPPNPLVQPGDGYVQFSLKNVGDTPVNVTFSFGDNAYFSSVTTSTQTTSVTKATIAAQSTAGFRLRVQTGSIPQAMIVGGRMNLLMEIIPEQYWKQMPGFESEVLTSVFLTFDLSFVASTLLAVPSDFKVEMQSNLIQTRTVQVFNLEKDPRTLTASIEFVTNSTSWLSFALDGPVPGNNEIGSPARCAEPLGTCEAQQQNIHDYSRLLVLTFNTTGLMNGEYFANLFVNTLTISCQLNVRGGPVNWAMSTFQFQSESGNLIPFLQDPELRVNVMPSFAITARDDLGNPTDNFGSQNNNNIQVRVDWTYFNTTSPCPQIAGEGCGGWMYATYSGDIGVFVARFQVNIKGEYQVGVLDPNNNPIGSRRTSLVDTLPNPTKFNVSAKVCNSENAVPNEIGSGCECKPGFGVSQASGVLAELACDECAAGTISSGGTGECNSCPDGYYQDKTGQTECKRCKGYLENPDATKTSCVSCGPYEYVRDTDPKWECKVCEVNRRVRLIRNKHNIAVNFTHPTYPELMINKYSCACNANMFYSTQLDTCVTCPTGGFCVDRDEDHILPRLGYWGPIRDNVAISSDDDENDGNGRRRRRLSQERSVFIPTYGQSITRSRKLQDDGVIPSNFSIPQFLPCRREDACPGINLPDSELGVDELVFSAVNEYNAITNSTDCTQCDAGFTGPLCFKCDGGYTRAGVDSCTKCLSRGAVVGLLILGAFFAIVVCIYIIRRTLANMEREGRDASSEMILLRVLMSHLQSESMVQGIDLDWPGFVLSMFDVFNLISSTGQSAFSLDCFVDEQTGSGESSCQVLTDNRLRTFFLSALFIALLPVFGLVCSSAYWLGRFLYIKQTTGKGRGKSFYQYNLVSVIIIVFLLYPSLVRTAFKFFSGSSETIAGARFLEADFNIVFGSAEHLTWALCLGLPMILVYALGVPFGFLYILKTRRADTHRYGKVFTFLYTGFQPDRYYWEVVIMVRKLGIAACTIMLRPYGADIQAFATASVVFIFICAQLHVRPYTHDSMNFVEFFGLATLYMTLFLGLFQSSINIGLGESSAVNTAFGIIIVLINVIFLMFIFGKLFEVTYRTGKDHGWRHALFMIATLGNVGSSKKDLLANEKQVDQSNSVAVVAPEAVYATETSRNPVFAKEISTSAIPQYQDLYGNGHGEGSKDGEVSYRKEGA